MSVYFAERDGLIKIGASVKPAERVAALKATLLAEIDIAERKPSHKAEGQLHRLFDDEAVGREWFIATPRLMAFIGALPVVVREKRIIWTTRRIADRFAVSTGTVVRWVEQGYIEAGRLPFGRRPQYRFNAAEVERFAAKYAPNEAREKASA